MAYGSMQWAKRALRYVAIQRQNSRAYQRYFPRTFLIFVVKLLLGEGRRHYEKAHAHSLVWHTGSSQAARNFGISAEQVEVLRLHLAYADDA